MIVQIVRFRSVLPEEEILRMYEARARRYRETPGLARKFYLRYPETGEHGAVYLWESEEALAEFRASDLARTIPETYRVQDAPDVQLAEVVLTLR
jgi:heme-degrading monooxygenase HmoA